jgi:hypothetical protein
MDAKMRSISSELRRGQCVGGQILTFCQKCGSSRILSQRLNLGDHFEATTREICHDFKLTTPTGCKIVSYVDFSEQKQLKAFRMYLITTPLYECF